MKLYALAVLMVICINCMSQNSGILSYTDSVNHAKSDTDKARFLYKLSYYYQNYKPDSALLLAQSSYKLSKKIHFLRGEIGSLDQTATAFNRLGNFAKALEYYLEQLKILEQNGDVDDIASAYLSLALVYNSEKDAAKALFYAGKADSIARFNHLAVPLLYIHLNIGDIYFNNNQLDSALLYTERSYAESINQKNNLIKGTALNNMGNIYFKKGMYNLTLINYKNAIPYLTLMGDYNNLSECNLGLAKTFDKLGVPDSALSYAYRSFQLASENQFLKNSVNASAFLAELYKKKYRIDSAFAYQEKYIQFKESFDNSEKIKQLQNLTISEQLRQQHMSEEKEQERKDMNERLQFFLIAMLIPIFFMISLYISNKKVKRKVIQISGVVSLLFLFEFITLLIHPVVANNTNHSPLIEILVLVAIASVILPAHHRLERWLVLKLTERHERHLLSLSISNKTMPVEDSIMLPQQAELSEEIQDEFPET